MKFKYQARTKRGESRVGTVEAVSKEAAISLLQKSGLYVTKLESASAPLYAKEVKIFSKISTRDLVIFSRQLAIMSNSGVSLIDALRTLSVQTKNIPFRRKILKLADYVEGGESFSKALSHFPKIFDLFYIGMVKSGEASGTLSESLSYLSDHLEREYYIKSQVKGAMIYPALVISVVFVVLGVMMFYVVPHISEVLKGMTGQLPFMTRVILNFSYLTRKWGWLGIIIFGVIVFCFYTYMKTEEGRGKWEQISLKLPVIGSFLKKVYVSRFAENLSVLISGGLPIVQALHLAADTVGNSSYRTAILKARDRTRKGEQVSVTLMEYPELFPPILVQMVQTGERTGKLGKTLKNVVEFYQKEVEISLKNMLKILEPALIIFLALIVGTIVAFILLPLYQIQLGATF